MNSLGIYFGPDTISIVQAQGRKLINHIQVPQKLITASDLEEKVPGEIKMVALFKDEFRKNNIAAPEASLALSGKDLIIRTFEMPVMPREDLNRAINFEAKKYLPFKAEELILDYQLFYDRSIRKNLVLLIGIKKDTLDRYISVFEQLNLRIVSLEYAAFSTLRLLKIGGAKESGIVAVIDIDFNQADEINFMVLKDGFPLFSREINLMAGPQESVAAEEADSGAILEKLKNELRISLDYYQRKFPLKKIERMFFISGKNYQSDLEALARDISLKGEFIDVDRCLGKAVPFSLSLVKGYSSALAKAMKITPRVDLIAAKTKQIKEVIAAAETAPQPFIGKDLRIQPFVIILVLLICAAAFLPGFYQKVLLEREINAVKSRRLAISAINPEATYEELTGIDSAYRNKLAALDKLIKDQLYLTFPLNAIPPLVPKGIWLQEFSFEKEEGQDKGKLILEGMVYLANSDSEFKAIDDFVASLKGNPEFSKYFKEIITASIDRQKMEKLMVTNFSISCRAY